MRDGHSRDTSFEVVRSQPQPSMSTTSPQYRSAAQTHSHYQNFPTSNHDHLYHDGLAAWQQAPTHDSYTAGPSTAPFLHYPHVGVDSASLHQQQPAPAAWSSGYVRQGPQEWHHPGPEQTYTSRSTIPYGDPEGSVSVPHQTPAVSRHYQHQQALNPGHALPLSPQENAYRSTERFHELRLLSVSAHRKMSYSTLDPRLRFSRSPPPTR
jgi:hypothetical protein